MSKKTQRKKSAARSVFTATAILKVKLSEGTSRDLVVAQLRQAIAEMESLVEEVEGRLES